MKFFPLSLIVACSLVTGCATTGQTYNDPFKTETSKPISIKPVAVAKFESNKPGLATIACRGTMPITVQPDFQSYIERVFVNRLKVGGAYDPTSSSTLFAKMDVIDFDSGVANGKWLLTMTLSNARKESFQTTTTFDFGSSYFGQAGCQKVSEAFHPAVEKLVEEALGNPMLKSLAN